MKFRTHIKVPLWERLRILWYGYVFIYVDYNGPHKKRVIQFTAINPELIKNDS